MSLMRVNFFSPTRAFAWVCSEMIDIDFDAHGANALRVALSQAKGMDGLLAVLVNDDFPDESVAALVPDGLCDLDMDSADHLTRITAEDVTGGVALGITVAGDYQKRIIPSECLAEVGSFFLRADERQSKA
jgi:hypothetical protein